MNKLTPLAVLVGLTSSASAESPSLPWQLQPVTADNVVRADSTVAVFNDPNANFDISETTALSARYQLNARWAPTLRVAVAGNNAPGAALDGGSISNPTLGVTYSRERGARHLALHASTTLPLGTGGGDTPDVQAARTNRASITARPADEARFQVNYLTQTVGGDIAYAQPRYTVQAEATLQQSIRVRGSRSEAGTDALRTRASLGGHASMSLGSHVSLGADLLYQRSLSHPTQLDMTGAKVDVADSELSRLTVTAGVRVHVRVGSASVHPGLSYTRGLDATEYGPMIVTNRTNAIALDVPVLF